MTVAAGAGRTPYRFIRATFRTQLWWAPKVLPAFGTALLAALLADAEPGPSLTRLAALLISAAGIAGASHLINDWADIEADALAGKPNLAATIPPLGRAALLLGAFVVGICPWLVVRPGTPAAALIGALVVLPVLYSAPPLRLKARGLGGVIADAADAHVVPSLLTFFVMVGAGTATRSWTIGLVAVGLWSTGVGVRAILHHQVLDLVNDREAHVSTYATRWGPGGAQRLGDGAFALELVGLAGIVVAIARTRAWVLVPFALYFAVWWLDQRWEPRVLEPVPSPGNDWMPLVEFYQVWPAAIFAVALLLDDPAWWPVPVALVALFTGALAKQGGDLARMGGSVGRDLRRRARVGDRLGVFGRAVGSYAEQAKVAVVRAVWWLRRGPIAWFRFQVYWPFHDWLMGFGHFRRRQVRRIRRHWRAARSKGSAGPGPA